MADTHYKRRRSSFVALLFLCGWLITRFVTPDARWWDILHTSLNAILISFVLALGATAGALWLLNQIHYRRGVFPCPYCGKPQRGFAITCDCPDAKAFRAGDDHLPNERESTRIVM